MLGGGEAGLRGGIGWEIMFATVKPHKVTFSHTNTQSHTKTLWLISGEAIDRLNFAIKTIQDGF